MEKNPETTAAIRSEGGDIATDAATIDKRSGGTYFGDQTVITGDVIGGDKYKIEFYAAASVSEDGKIDWPKFQQTTKREEPYKFLNYYEITDADIFYGREGISKTLVSELVSHKVVLISGKSGSGKTSLINAGVIPALMEKGYFTIVFRDYGYPTKIIKNGITSLENVKIDLDGCNTLFKVLEKTIHKTKRPLAIFLDQFERFFENFEKHEKVKQQFFQEIQECFANFTGDQLNIVISFQEDYHGKLLKLCKNIPEFKTQSSVTYLEPLSRKKKEGQKYSEAEEAILRPLRELSSPKMDYEEGFVENTLLPALDSKEDGDSESWNVEPTHLQIVCNKLYKEVKEREREKIAEKQNVIITSKFYDTLGGVKGILQTYLSEEIQKYDKAEKGSAEHARQILKLMVLPGQVKTLRKFVSVKQLYEYPGNKMSQQEIEKLLSYKTSASGGGPKEV